MISINAQFFDRMRREFNMSMSYAKFFSEISLTRLMFSMRKRYRL
jgi:hypothetical protein